MFGRLHVVIESEKEEDYQDIKNKLLKINPCFSISFARPWASKANTSEFYCTVDLKDEDVDALLSILNNDWTGERESCFSYGFNTKMFDPMVYYIEFDLFE